jgi:photosystem II stability/assembly factor-like uncharacterized protein
MNSVFKTTIVFLFLFFPNAIKAQWVNINAPTLDVGNCIYFTSVDTGYMVSADFNNGGKIFKTTNGASWANQLAINDYLFAVHFVSNQVGWAAGGVIGGGIIMKTTDGGATWITQTNTCEQVLSLFFVNDTLGWAAATDATQGTYFIYNTTNGGATWTTQQTGSDYVRSVFFINETTGWIAGDNGRIFGTTNGGVNWNLLTSGIPFHFNDILFISAIEGWAVGAFGNGGCYKTNDGGNTWTAQTLPTTAPLTSVHFVNANEGWACGTNGLILRTNDGGNNWQQENSSTTNSLNSVCFLNANTGYATGNQGTVIKYSDPTKIEKSDVNSTLLIYPNPSNGIVNVQLYKRFSYYSLDLFSVHGSHIASFNLNSYCQSHEIDLSGYNDGLYFLRFNSKEHVLFHKVMLKK